MTDSGEHDPALGDSSFSAWWQDWLLAVEALTLFKPEIDPPADARALGRSRRAYPLVGLLLGLLAIVLFGLGRSLAMFDFGAATFAIALLVLVTGAKGEIGLAVYVEAVAQGRTVEQRRALLLQAPFGYAGVLAMCFSLLLRVALLTAVLDDAPAVLMAVVIGSRTALALAPAFRPDDSPALDAPAERLGNDWLWLAAALGVAFLLLFLGPWSGLVAAVVGFFAMLAAIGIVRRQCEGFAAPAYGFVQQVSETALLIAAVASP
ncbi:MAG: adenosylcobinamide-GDP ribazoletransferase [Rhodospirillaceae bacterium]|nr:adenosylcobinamide-GDP ribazoletransferase [Rhodospirillaceae bacterium]